MLTAQLALVSEVDGHDPSDVARVSAAVQKQLDRDFAPVWVNTATIDVFPTTDDIPPGYWPIIVSDKFTFGSLGTHNLENGEPFALVKMSDSWSLTVSHEALEMVADPSGNRTSPGISPEDGTTVVQFLVEICDPCEGASNGYVIDGILVSDFYTQQYFDPFKATSARYSFTGAITSPRQVLADGYVTWFDPTSGDWRQLRRDSDGTADYPNLGPDAGSAGGSIREAIDRLTPQTALQQGLSTEDETLKEAVTMLESASAAAKARSARLQARIADLEAGN
jgi:hypothetical protein